MSKLVLTVKELEAFWKKVHVISRTCCWEWLGSYTSDKGNGHTYPAMYVPGHDKLNARRMSYLIHFNSLPKFVGCTCDNPKCVNPQHLTPYPSRGRVVRKSATEVHRKLSERTVRKIITMRRMGHTQAFIAKKLDLAFSRVNLVLKMTRFCQEGKLTTPGPLPRRIAKEPAVAS